MTPESQFPSGVQQLPDVEEWNDPTQFHCTVCPALIVVVLLPLCWSRKLLPPCPTLTMCAAACGVGVGTAPMGVGVGTIPTGVGEGFVTGCVGELWLLWQEKTKATAVIPSAQQSAREGEKRKRKGSCMGHLGERVNDPATSRRADRI